MKIGNHEIKAAIFDVDGTILDSMPYWINAADEYLDRLNIPHSDGVGKMFLSMNMEEGAEYLRQKYLPDPPNKNTRQTNRRTASAGPRTSPAVRKSSAAVKTSTAYAANQKNPVIRKSAKIVKRSAVQ